MTNTSKKELKKWIIHRTKSRVELWLKLGLITGKDLEAINKHFEGEEIKQIYFGEL